MNHHGALGLFLFLSGAFYISAVSVRDTLGDVPWQYMPQTTLAASAALYNATFIPAAQGYMAVLDGVGDIQADAYRTTGVGVSAAAAWYKDSNAKVDARLAP